MAATKNNQYWKLRKKHGRDNKFVNPGLLWKATCKYFNWCDKHPCVINRHGYQLTVPRPYSIHGLTLFLGVSHSYFRIQRKEMYNEVIEMIKTVIETQQFEGACVGAFNPNIIARQLGLTGKQEVIQKEEQLFKGFTFLSHTHGCTPKQNEESSSK